MECCSFPESRLVLAEWHLTVVLHVDPNYLKDGQWDFSRPVIHKCNVFCPEEIHSVPSCMACGIIMLKMIDIGIILKQWNNVPGKNFLSVALGIQIPFDNDEISAKAICSTRPPQPISFMYATVGIAFTSPTRTLPLPQWMVSLDLSEKRTLFHCCSSQRWWVRTQLKRFYAVTSRQNTTNIWNTCT